MVFPTGDQHAISTTFKYAYVKHNLPKPFPQVYPAVNSLHSRESLDNYY